RYLKNNHIVSFIGFAPADDPEMVVLVAIDNPKNTIQFGGVVAGPIVGKIMDEGVPVLGVQRRADGLNKKYDWPEEPKESVPYLKNNHIVSFIGFAPADGPEMVVLVAIDNPKNTIQFGGVVAGPIVGKIMDEGLPVLGVQRRADGLNKKYDWPEEPKESVPDLIGSDKEILLEDLSNFEFESQGEGDYIIDQSPD